MPSTQSAWDAVSHTSDTVGCSIDPIAITSVQHPIILFGANWRGWDMRNMAKSTFTLHCKIGDTVYIPDVEKGIVAPVRVQGISITVSGRVLLHFGGYPAECAWDYDCGKGWYKTSEAAEKALEEVNG